MKVMLDLETLSSKSNAAIVAIGAVAFDRKEVHLDKKFYCLVSPESSEKAGLHISGSTFIWWTQQSEAARAMFKEKGLSLVDALSKFSMWCQDTKVDEMWGNGSDFDCTILGASYDAVDAYRPWKYSQNRCFRTLKSLVPAATNNELWDKHAAGTHHNALDDAVRQAYIACDIFKLLDVRD